MMTRNMSRTGIVSNDENANVLGKLSEKTMVHRPRPILGEIENLTIAEVSSNACEKPKQRSQVRLRPNTILSKCALLKCVRELSPPTCANFINFYNKRNAIRSRCFREDPHLFLQMDATYGLNEKSKCGVTEGMFEYLQNTELLSYPLPPLFLSNCPDVNSRMRYILVNWMVQVHQSYKLNHETLFLAIGLLDRFVHKAPSKATKDNFQLIGTSALYIASKFEEMCPPDVADYSSLTEGCFSSDDVIQCEQTILGEMDFLINIPCPLLFLRRLAAATRIDSLVYNLCKYFIEIAFQEYELAHYTGNFLSVVVMCLALAVVSGTHVIDDVWSDTLGFISGYTIEDVRIPIQILARAILRQREPSKYRATYDKFRTEEYFQRVAAMPELESPVMRLLSGML